MLTEAERFGIVDGLALQAMSDAQFVGADGLPNEVVSHQRIAANAARLAGYPEGANPLVDPAPAGAVPALVKLAQAEAVVAQAIAEEAARRREAKR